MNRDFMKDLNISEIDNGKIAIVVVGYDRLQPIRRLLSSLLSARYEGNSIPLYISIDCSNNEDLYKFVNDFRWPYGNKYVNIEEKRLGLKNHILQCGDLTRFFKAIILLEDDIFVGEYFYEYAQRVVSYYENDDRIGGFSLYTHEIGGTGVPIAYYHNGSDAFLRQDVVSWGECWTKSQWAKFREWFDRFNDKDFARIDIPESTKRWKSSWTKYYAAYLVDTNRYFVCPYVSNTTCFCDAGEHFDMMTMSGQVCLMSGPISYKFLPFDEMIRYDVYWANESVCEWLGIRKSDVCVDWYNLIHNKKRCRYLLSTIVLPFKIIRKYGLFLRPIELNVKYNIEGEGIYLYDTLEGDNSSNGGFFTLSFANYCVRSVNRSLLVKYLKNSLSIGLKRKFLKGIF